jgi:hypothetical protein
MLIVIEHVLLSLPEGEVTNYYRLLGEVYKNTSVVFLMEAA